MQLCSLRSAAATASVAHLTDGLCIGLEVDHLRLITHLALEHRQEALLHEGLCTLHLQV